jgi:hypothetical protein
LKQRTNRELSRQIIPAAIPIALLAGRLNLLAEELGEGSLIGGRPYLGLPASPARSPESTIKERNK